ncbi:MAG: VIT1/CCC1 transporter family protein [Parachlamydiales bacterium]|jgi:hypothetical protein
MCCNHPHNSPEHFDGKTAVGHVAEAQARGKLAKSESHALEIPGHWSAFTDAARETALLMAMLFEICHHLPISSTLTMVITGLVGISWLIWKAGRSAWIGWSRLERLHRIVEEEKWEIDNHRKQEREELGALYAAKGFEGKLLEDVLDVLMADGDRLLRVMVEEELGLTLENTEHPLKQALGAALGSTAAILLIFLFVAALGSWGALLAALLTAGLAAAIAAKYEKNRIIPAIVWNIGIVALPLACVHFLSNYFIGPSL